MDNEEKIVSISIIHSDKKKKKYSRFIIFSLLIHLIALLFFLEYAFLPTNLFQMLFHPFSVDEKPVEKLAKKPIQTQVLLNTQAQLRFQEESAEGSTLEKNVLHKASFVHMPKTETTKKNTAIKTETPPSEGPQGEKKRQAAPIPPHNQTEAAIRTVQNSTLQIPLADLKKFALSNLLKKNDEKKDTTQTTQQEPKQSFFVPLGGRNQVNTSSILMPIKVTLGTDRFFDEAGNSNIARNGDPNQQPTEADLKLMTYGRGVGKVLSTHMNIAFAKNSKSSPCSPCQITIEINEKGDLISCTLESSLAKHELGYQFFQSLKSSGFYPHIPKRLGATSTLIQIQLAPFLDRNGTEIRGVFSMKFFSERPQKENTTSLSSPS